METFDAGATDLELYMGLDGLGSGTGQGSTAFGAEVVAGYGIYNRLSIALGATLSGDETLDETSGGVYLSLFGTPIDTRHVDLDLMLTGAAAGSSMRELELAPGLELNLDGQPDMSSWGLYARLAAPIYGSSADDELGAASETALRLEAALGGYLTLASNHQLLLEVDATHVLRDPAAEGTEVGALALGYNVVLNDTFELINQVSLDIPQGDERLAVGFTSGLIATLPQ